MFPPRSWPSLCTILSLGIASISFGQTKPTNVPSYRIIPLPHPEGMIAEAGGLATLPDGRLAVATRRGEVWIAANPYEKDGKDLQWTRFASALHEPLGMTFHQGDLYVSQRSEITRLRDTDSDGIADEYHCAAKGWGVSGAYHEYTYGPKFDPSGNMWITLNSTMGDPVYPNQKQWRGYSLRASLDGTLQPVSGGMRSPCGIGINEAGDVFYSDQQGQWNSACGIHHIQQGAFHGHPASFASCDLPNAPFAKPQTFAENVPVAEAARLMPIYRPAAVWLPYRKMGMSTTDITLDTTKGKFGPFAGQFLVGELTQASINRIFIEKIDGEYQAQQQQKQQHPHANGALPSSATKAAMVTASTACGSMWQHVPNTKVIAAADPDAKSLAATLKELDIPQGFADFRQIDEAKPDLVAIGPGMNWHRDMALAAAASGAKGIYLEKPFCRNLTEADEIIAACNQHGVKLALAHRNRTHPALPIVRQLCQDGAIGRLLELRGRGKEDRRGGPEDLWILGSHVLNIAVYLSGRPIACSAEILKEGRPIAPADIIRSKTDLGPIAGDAVHARFEMESSIPFYFDSVKDAGDTAAGFGIQVIGTKGVIDLRMDRTPLAHLIPGNPFQPSSEPRPWIPISTTGPGKEEPIASLSRHVMSHAAGAFDLIHAVEHDQTPLCSALDGRLTVEMIMAILSSHRQNGQRITFPLTTTEHPFENWS